MIISTMDLFDVSWEQDYADRMNPELLTGLLRSTIPVLDHSGWAVDKVDEGFCQSVLPLNTPTTNQHGTHQAALISLSADYTGGVALSTLLRGVPIAGVHRCCEEDSASLWLASMNVKYKVPSSGHLTGTCRVDAEKAESIRRRYFCGKRVMVTLEIEFSSNGDQVAVAEMKYFAQPTKQLMPQPGSKNRSTLFSHKLKASARMIAGLRGRTSANPKLTASCPYAALSAGPHGELLADRLQNALPQLTDMVLGRTQHIDETIRDGDYRQVVMLGAGLDMRSLRHAAEDPEKVFFELDLPEMIDERRRVIEQFPEGHWDQRVMLSVDFRKDSLAASLAADRRFDASLPTLFIYEGCTMYFTESENENLLQDVHALMGHSESRIWFDVVGPEIVTGRTNQDSITAFLEGMDELGESFIFGVEDVGQWTQSIGLQSVHVLDSGEYLCEQDPVFSNYRFALVGPGDSAH